MANWAKDKINQAFEAGKASGRGFISSRINAAVGGAKDVAGTAVELGKNTLGTETSEGSPGVLGVIKNTALSVKDALVSEERGVLNPKKGSLNPFNGEGWLNPFKYARRMAAGTTEITAEAIGGIIGVISERTGNAVKGIIRGGSRSVGGIILGDYGQYLGHTPPETDTE